MQHLAVERRHHVDVRVLAAVREVGDAVALRRDRRGRVERALVVPVVGEPARELFRRILVRDRRPVALAQPGSPLLVELPDRHAHAGLERAIEAPVLPDAPQDVPQAVLAVAVDQVAQRRLPLLVDDVAGRQRERRQVALDDAVAQEHLGVGLDPERKVLGQAFGEPRWHRVEALARDQRRRRATVQVVEHHGVRELVHHHVAQVLIGAGERQHHPVAQHLGETAGAGVDQLGGDVGLGKVIVGAVQDDGDAPRQGVAHALRQHRLGLLGEVQRAHGEAVLAGVEVDLEVVRLDRAPVVLAILDLVLPEVLGVRRTGAQGAEECRQHPRRELQLSHSDFPFWPRIGFARPAISVNDTPEPPRVPMTI